MESNPVEEVTAMSKEEFKTKGWRGHYLNKPHLDRPLIDIAPIYTFDDIRQVEQETEKILKGKTKLKILEIECEIDPSITLYDIKLNARGIIEDNIYLSFIDVLKNIRRGNTYVT